MTDLEITRLCAKAMNIPPSRLQTFMDADFQPQTAYDPLHSDAQAMALDGVIIDEKHGFWMSEKSFVRFGFPGGMNTFEFSGDMTKPENRRRARCECVAKMERNK